MYALTSATARRLIVLSREHAAADAPKIELSAIDDRAIHYARALEDVSNSGLVSIELALRLRDRRGSHRFLVSLQARDEFDLLLVPISLLLEDLAGRELEAWRGVDGPPALVGSAVLPERP